MSRQTKTNKPGAKRFFPKLETLERRETPVVGAFSPIGTTTNSLYDGVVLVHSTDGVDSFIGTGTLLVGKTHILTAAHVVTSDTGAKLSGTIDFVLGSGTQSIVYTSADVTVVNGFQPSVDSSSIVPNDVALIRINGTVPLGVEGFDLYRGHEEIGRQFTMVGFGETGTGTAGESSGTSGIKREGTNTFETTGNAIDSFDFFRNLGYDFDDGTTGNNSLQVDFGIPSNLGVSSGATFLETAVGSGDSGGPGFLNLGSNLVIAGIVSGSTDASRFGSTGEYARVSAFARAIDLIVGIPDGRTETTNYAVSPGSNSTPNVHVYDSTILYPNNQGPTSQNAVANILAYDAGFSGGVTIAMGDVNRDGFADVITGAGPGGGPNVKVFSGADYTTVLYNFFAFEPAFGGGVTLGSGDVNADGYDDIVVGAGPGGGPRVKVFSGMNLEQLRDFFAFEPAFTGGVQVASGRINFDSNSDIIVGAGAGGGPRVMVLSGADQAILQDFFAYDPSFRGGVFVASGAIGGGNDKTIVGAGAGGGPNVRVFDANTNMLQNFFAYAVGFSGGVRVASGIMTTSGSNADIITAPGAGGGPNVSAFNSLNQLLPINFFAFNPDFSGGIFVAGIGDPISIA